MVTINATCFYCAEQHKFSPEDVKLVHCEDTEVSSSVFQCPHCHRLNLRRAEEPIVKKMISLKCPIVIYTLPEPSERLGGPPLTLDDLLDFHLAVEREGWEHELEDRS